MTILEINPKEWHDHLDRAPFRISHRLLDDDRMTAESLAQLTERLPATSVEHNYGEIPALLPTAPTSRAQASPAEILRAPDFHRSWMVIKHIEQDPAYRDLLMACLADVDGVPGVHLAQRNRQGYVFASANGSVTPCHTDPEENFLLQIQGSKEITIGSFPDPETKQAVIERKALGGHRYIDFLPADPQTFRLEPGDGVYVPPNTPHFVKVFDEPSISLSVTFRTPQTDLFDDVVYVNARLRRLGLTPKSPGQNQHIDRAKAIAARVRDRATQWRK